MFDLVKWNPVREMADFQRQIDRFFNAPLFGLGSALEEGRQGMWYPAADMYEKDDALVIQAELPGLTKDDIDVTVRDGRLTLSGERKFESEVKDEKYYRCERSYGKFMRSFDLPADVDPDKIEAEFKDGLLKIHIPKLEEKKPKKIAVH